MKKKAILTLSFLIFAFTVYSIGMLFAQYQISIEVSKNIDRIIKNSPNIQNIEHSHITLSPLFFMNKKYYINNCFLRLKEIPSEIYINKISVIDFFINEEEIIPKYINADKIEFFNLKKIEEHIKNLSPTLEKSKTTLNYFLNSPYASFIANYNHGQYTGEFKLFLNNKDILHTSYDLKNILPLINKNPIILNLKSFKLNLEKIPIDSQKAFSNNKILLEILGEDYKNIFLNLNMNYQTTDKKAILITNIDIEKIITIKAEGNFYIDNILKLKDSIVNKFSIQLIDQDFLEKYYKKEATKQKITLEEAKTDAIKQNNMFLLFISNTPLEEGIQEFNQFIMNPNKFTIIMRPESPITLQKIRSQAKEDYFGLLHFLKIKFKANSEILDQTE